MPRRSSLQPSGPRRTRGGVLLTRPPYARMFKIHEYLAAGKYPNCARLAQDFEVSAKTVQRDIDFMRDQLQLPIDYDPVQHGFYYTKAVTTFPALTMTHGEVVALLVAQKALEQYRGTAFEKPLREAFDKMATSLPTEGSFSLHELSQAFSFRPIGAAKQELAVFGVLSDSILKCVTLEFDYQPLRAPKSERRRIEPYHLGCIGNQWYLIGHDLVRGKLRTFAVTRLSRPKHMKRIFRRPDDFSITEMLSGSFSIFETPRLARVEIRLDSFAARLASERIWHDSQKLVPRAGGGATLTMEVGLAPDLENWILSWGVHAEVIGPEDLRDRIASISRSMALQYPA